MNLGLLGAGLVFGIAAIGSGIGIGICGMATIGVWKKTYIANKPASMLMLAFAGNPLTQVFYGYILMGQIKNAAFANPENGWMYLGFSLASAAAIGFTAVVQGKIGAVAVDALGETGKGFAQYLIIMGVAETVALFAMVLTMVSL